MNLYAIRDIKADAFASPFHIQNDGMAVRAASDVALDTNSLLNKHPSDYEVWFLGSFDESTGIITSSPRHLVGVNSLIIKS